MLPDEPTLGELMAASLDATDSIGTAAEAADDLSRALTAQRWRHQIDSDPGTDQVTLRVDKHIAWFLAYLITDAEN